MRFLLLTVALFLAGLSQVHAQVPIGKLFESIVREGLEAAEPQSIKPNAAITSNIYDGLSRDELMSIQASLAAQGFYRGAIDGQFGRQSRAAAASYQREAGEEPTGYLSPRLVAVLIAEAQSASQAPQVGAAASEQLGEVTAVGEVASLAMVGMPVRDGVLQIYSSAYVASFGGKGDRAQSEYSYSFQRFIRLLELAGNPSIIDMPEETARFMSLIDPSRLTHLVIERDLERLRQRSRFDEGQWVGTNQFAIEDSRKAFLAQFREEILSMVPSLPLRVDFVSKTSFGSYSRGDLAVRIETPPLSPWPFQMPDALRIDSGVARQMIEMAPPPDSPAYFMDPKDFRMPVLVTKAMINGVRRTPKGAAYDIEVLDAQIYASVDRTISWGPIPLPYGVGVAPSAPSASVPAVNDTRTQGESQTLPIEGPTEITQERHTFEMLGVRLGMPLADAETAIGSALDGSPFTRVNATHAGGSDELFGSNDPVMGEAILFRSPPIEVDSLPDERGAQAIRLYFDTTQPEHPIIAVSRSVKIGPENASNDAAVAIGEPVLATMVEKYGQPDWRDQVFGNKPIIWATNPTIKAQISAKNGPCRLSEVVSRAYSTSGPLRSREVKERCGELLSAYFGWGRVNTFLADTDRIIDLRQHYVEEMERSTADKSAQPPISF